MSLPSKAIDRLFERLATTYGREWTSKWEGLDSKAVKALWAHELSVFVGRLDAIAWALENLPDRCPNVIGFRALCRQAPEAVAAQLDMPKADPARVAAELTKLAPVITPNADQPRRDYRAWAKRVLDRAAIGDPMSPAVLAMAQRASAAGAEASV